MRQFLSAEPIAVETHRITLEASDVVLRRGGLVSPVFPAFADHALEVAPSDAIALLYPASPRALLSAVQIAEGQLQREQFFISHGLASVGLAGPNDGLVEMLARYEPYLRGWELWRRRDGLVTRQDVERREPEYGFPPETVDMMDVADLPYDARCHLRQLNSNVAYAIERAARYVPEFVPMLVDIAREAGQIADRLREVDAASDGIDAVRQHHYYASVLVEMNSALTMMCSQAFGGVQPILYSEYPVGEYSLLGVGGVVRGLWALYTHIDGAFAAANHANRARDSLFKLAAFDPFADRQRLDFSQWDDRPSALQHLPTSDDRRHRPHLIHYSARFGYHETVSTMGASWQSLYASASKEWHVLTLSHEYLHSHVRALTAQIFPDDLDLERLASLVRRETEPQNARESAQLALTSAMLYIRPLRLAAQDVELDGRLDLPGFNASPNSAQVRSLLDLEVRHTQEILVHVLDYLYVFDGEDAGYVESIWSTWATVPSVDKRLHNYLLRTICALAARSIRPQRDETPVFVDAAQRLEHCLDQMLANDAAPVVVEAQKLLRSSDGRNRLSIEFSQTYYLVRLATCMFYDESVASHIRGDESTAIRDEGGVTYAVEPGDYLNDAPNPVLFLDDRLRSYPTHASEKTEYESVWQMLQLIEPGRRSQ